DPGCPPRPPAGPGLVSTHAKSGEEIWGSLREEATQVPLQASDLRLERLAAGGQRPQVNRPGFTGGSIL
ncbi:MAG: hypothetical protein ACREJP_00970, partial [Candidatus Methylomirabilales bacterium]